MIKNIWGEKKESEHKAMLKDLEETFNYIDLLSVFYIDSTDKITELDDAILYSLLKAQNSILKSLFNFFFKFLNSLFLITVQIIIFYQRLKHPEQKGR